MYLKQKKENGRCFQSRFLSDLRGLNRFKPKPAQLPLQELCRDSWAVDEEALIRARTVRWAKHWLGAQINVFETGEKDV